MVGTGPISLVQAGLDDDDRPLRMSPPDRGKSVENWLLDRVERPDHSQQQLRAAFTERDVFGWVIGDFPEAAGVEEPHDRRFCGEIKYPRDAGTCSEAGADFGRGGAGQCAND